MVKGAQKRLRILVTAFGFRIAQACIISPRIVNCLHTVRAYDEFAISGRALGE